MLDWWNKNAKEHLSAFKTYVGDHTAKTKQDVRRYVMSKGYSSILDCGCGLCSDYYGYRIDESKIEYTGIDMCEYFIETAKEHGINAVLGTIEDIPFETGIFDVVSTRHVLEHLASFENAMLEMIRVAKKEIIVTFFITPGEEECISNEIHGGVPLYHNRYKKQDIEKFLSGMGLTYRWEGAENGECILHILKDEI